MRGDSLRDFYAKTFVVLGLGVLAAGGALVDYWPSNGELPSVSAVADLRPAAPQLIQDLTREIPAPVARPVIREVARATDTDQAAPVTPPAEVSLTLTPAPIEEPIPADFIVGLAMIEIPMLALALEDPLMSEPAISGQAAEGIRTRMTDVLKRTRDSVKDARSSLRGAWSGALSGVVGAFKRVNPFFNSNSLSFR